jgi:hypothetical protein
MNLVINGLFIIGSVVAAVYIAPFLIALIASGIIQLLIGIGVVYCIIKIAYKSSPRDFDKYR